MISKRSYRLCPQLWCLGVRAVFVAHVTCATAAQSSLVRDHRVVPRGQSLRQRSGFGCANAVSEKCVQIHVQTQPLSWHARATRSIAIKYAASRRETCSRSAISQTAENPAAIRDSSFRSTSSRSQ